MLREAKKKDKTDGDDLAIRVKGNFSFGLK